jgi:hypothetical protein
VVDRAGDERRIPRSVIVAGSIVLAVSALITVFALRNEELDAGRISVIIVVAIMGLGLIRGIRAMFWIVGVGLGLMASIAAVSLLDETSSGTIIGAIVLAAAPALLFMSPSARAWGFPRDRQQRSGAVGEPVTVDHLPVVEGWHRPKLGGRLKFWFLLLFGLLAWLAGVAMAGLGDADDRGPGIVIAFFGLGLLLSSPLFRTWKRGGRPGIASVVRNGRPDTGLSFPYSRYKTRASAIAMICMGAASCGLAISPESFADPGESTTTIRIVGTLGAILLGGIGTLVLIRKAGAGWHVTLLPSGVAAVAAGTTSFVPWDAIDSIAAFDFTLYTRGFANHEPYIGINATDPDRIEISKTGRMLMKTNRLLGTDLAYSVRALEVEPALLYHALLYYLEHPDARSELSGHAGLDRVEQGRLEPRRPPT